MNNTLEIRLDHTACRPGEELTGRAVWQLGAVPSRVELRLVWSTRGRASSAVGVVETVQLSTLASGDEPFRIKLPQAPYSFSGKLISLVWALELVAEPGGHGTSVELVIGPNAAEVVLGAC